MRVFKVLTAPPAVWTAHFGLRSNGGVCNMLVEGALPINRLPVMFVVLAFVCADGRGCVLVDRESRQHGIANARAPFTIAPTTSE